MNEILTPDNILTFVTGAVTVASIIVKITPNEIDNKVINTIMNILNVISINNKKRSE